MSLPQEYQWYLDADTFGDGGVGGGGVPGLPKIEARIRVPTAGYDLALTDANGTDVPLSFPAGDYYLNSVAPGGTVSFLQALAVLMSAGAVTYTVICDDDNDNSTGRVTITGPGPWTLSWLDPIPREILGFTGSTATGTAVTGANHARHLTLPNVGRQPNEPDPNYGESEDIYGDNAEDIGRQESDYVVTCAPSGATSQTAFSRRRLFVLIFEPLLGQKMWRPNEQIVNESFERLWMDVMDNGGCPIRYHNWRADDDQYWTQVFDNDVGELKPAIMVPGWVGPLSHWRLELPLRKYIPLLVNGVYE